MRSSARPELGQGSHLGLGPSRVDRVGADIDRWRVGRVGKLIFDDEVPG